MNIEDLRLQRLIQGILVRNYVDTQQLDIQVIGHSAYIEGEFRVFEYHPSQKKDDRIERELGVKRVIMHVEQQIRSMGEITHLEMKFTNWERRGHMWVSKHSL